jgi:hypothetical protein
LGRGVRQLISVQSFAADGVISDNEKSDLVNAEHRVSVVTKENMMIRYLLAALLVASTGTAFAASGGSPNGKPFVEINDQLVAVQGDVDSIKNQIESLTSRVESIEEESGCSIRKT